MERIRIIVGMAGVTGVTLILLFLQIQVASSALLSV
jgi:hypothetical protein